MRTIQVMCAVAGLMVSGVALGQGSPFPSEIQGNYARIKANVIKAAEKMPADGYSFKPTADIRTFARVVNHVTEAQMHICGASNGATATDAKMPAETADKAAIVDALKASFAECDKAYAGLTEANQAELLSGAGPAKRSRLSMLWGNVAHDNEQYATLSLYLRLKGLVPPSSEK
jgi:uncharacterized damage-inducible protein DinB